jgi:hypothetical protein
MNHSASTSVYETEAGFVVYFGASPIAVRVILPCIRVNRNYILAILT